MNEPAPLLALGFVHPALLVGLGLAGLPVLIHLLSRRRFRRLEWAAMRFLLEAEKQSRRRVRLAQWLLLALRCLALAVLALIVARPFVPHGLVARLLGARGRMQQVVVLDDSASLSYGEADQTEFGRLRAAAIRLLSWLQREVPDGTLTLLLASRPQEPLVNHAELRELRLPDLRARLERLAPASLPARPRRLLARVAELLAAAPEPANVYILSDFQRSEWAPGAERPGATAPARAARGPVFAPLGALGADRLRVVLLASGQQPRDNAALLGLRLERPPVVAGLPALVSARLANYTRRALRRVSLRLQADGAALLSVPLEELPPGQQRQVRLEVTLPDPGYRVLTVSLGALDAFPPDNTRRLGARVREALQVLLVNGQPDPDPQRDEVYLLRNALAPPGPFSSGLRLGVIVPGQIAASALSAYDCVLLCNVPAPLPAGALTGLERYVRRGGGLVFFLGAQVGDGQEYNRLLYAGGHGLLPLPLGPPAEPRNAPRGVGLLRVGNHPLTALFPAGADALADYVHFWRYYQCAAEARPAGRAPQTQGGGARPGATVIARYADQARSPALVERRFGRGRVVLCTSTADLEWNDWARAMDGSYVVTLLELVHHVSRRDRQPAAFCAGQRLTLSLAPDRYQPGAVFRSPAAGEAPLAARVAALPAGADEPLVLEGPRATHLGTYEVELTRRSGEVESRPLCVNLDPVESDLARARPAELAAGLGAIPHEFLPASAGLPDFGRQSRHELWPVLLLVLVALLMSEQALAWWFGRPSAAGLGQALGPFSGPATACRGVSGRPAAR